MILLRVKGTSEAANHGFAGNRDPEITAASASTAHSAAASSCAFASGTRVGSQSAWIGTRATSNSFRMISAAIDEAPGFGVAVGQADDAVLVLELVDMPLPPALFEVGGARTPRRAPLTCRRAFRVESSSSRMRDDDPSPFRTSRHGCGQCLQPNRTPCPVRKYCLVARSTRAPMDWLDSLTGSCGLSLPVLNHGALAMANSGQPTSYKTEYCAQARN